MFCHNCGAPIADDADFCHLCGVKVAREDVHTSEEAEPKQAAAETSLEMLLKWSRPVFAVIAITVVVLLFKSGALDGFVELIGSIDREITRQSILGTTSSTSTTASQEKSAAEILLEAVGGSASPTPTPSESPFAWVEKPHITESEFRTKYIVGAVQNTSGTDFSYASIEFLLYDAAGNQIDTAVDGIDHFKAGNTWKFKAMIIQDDVTSFEFLHITY